MEDRLHDLEQRLLLAERRERATRCLGLLALAGIGLLLTARPAVTQDDGTTLKTPFKVLGKDGKAVLEVDSTAVGNTLTLKFDGETGGYLTASPEGGRLQLHEPSGKPLVSLTATNQGGDVMLLDAAEPKNRSILTSQHLTVNSRDGWALVRGHGFALHGPGGGVSAQLTNTATGGSIAVYDGDRAVLTKP